MKAILVIGGGFAGLWAAVAAARKLAENGTPRDTIGVTLVDRHDSHNIRVRNYEADLSPVLVPFDDVLDPIGVERIRGDVAGIDLDRKTVLVRTDAGERQVHYDRLVYALGSELVRPAVPGLAEFGFDVDSYAGAKRLDDHLKGLRELAATPGRDTIVVVGGGLTGIETAAEMVARLEPLAGDAPGRRPRVLLLDAHPVIGAGMGEAAPVIAEALAALQVESRGGVVIDALGPAGLTLAGGEFIAAETIVWCGGMRAHPLSGQLPIECDRLGRLPVDEFMRVEGLPDVYAAGDAAWSLLDGVHPSVMSCQHARPMGRYAGHNVAADLLGLPPLPLHIDWYVTVLDLGRWGAAYTVGRERRLVSQGMTAKRTKQVINRERIYPPPGRDRDAILAAAAPIVQAPPEVISSGKTGRAGSSASSLMGAGCSVPASAGTPAWRTAEGGDVVGGD